MLAAQFGVCVGVRRVDASSSEGFNQFLLYSRSYSSLKYMKGCLWTPVVAAFTFKWKVIMQNTVIYELLVD